MLSSAGLWLNASKSESMLESDETCVLPNVRRVLIGHTLLCAQDRMTDPSTRRNSLDAGLLKAILIVWRGKSFAYDLNI